ncbi:MAG: type II toxin-antitoxin system VapC family toxin [bacterium]|nr:type II toxin-antitoxin system VapC family toxin [bacterium]
MTRYLLDTNHLSLALRPGSALRGKIRRAREQGMKVGTCVPVLCELEVGASQVRDPELYRKILKRFMTKISVWPIDLETARIYADIYHEVRRRGRVLSQVDMMAAALARQMKLSILTTDRDFEALPSLRTEDWSGR